MLNDAYLREVQRMLAEVAATQGGPISQAADLIAASIADGGVVHLFGCGHSQMLTEEVFYRAGGLACVNPILDAGLALSGGAAKSSQLERMEGYGLVALSQQDLRAGEVMVVISTSGRNPVPVDVALEARRRGLKVVALTSVAYSRAAKSRHSSGQVLCDVADVVIDTCGVPGDAVLGLPGVAVKFSPVSTVIGAAVLNAVMARVVELLVERGVEPPIFLSGNLDGADARNMALVEKYRARAGRLSL
ncbi:MAG TPA: SIS domain-containing protein [Symbiobacteriaceae bacterium]|nr:SIS domain-containing protein [Symbiobacteriaceae bacterium]